MPPAKVAFYVVIQANCVYMSPYMVNMGKNRSLAGHKFESGGLTVSR